MNTRSIHRMAGGYAKLIAKVPNRVRAAADKSGDVISQFLAGESYSLLDGPACADGLVFWEIADPSLPAGSGWTAEGDLRENYLEL
jgi:hypothetical protein